MANSEILLEKLTKWYLSFHTRVIKSANIMISPTFLLKTKLKTLTVHVIAILMSSRDFHTMIVQENNVFLINFVPITRFWKKKPVYMLIWVDSIV